MANILYLRGAKKDILSLITRLKTLVKRVCRLEFNPQCAFFMELNKQWLVFFNLFYFNSGVKTGASQLDASRELSPDDMSFHSVFGILRMGEERY